MSQFTFIIQFKYDSSDRLTNLLRGLIYLTHQFKHDAEYLVVLQNDRPHEEYATQTEYLHSLFLTYEINQFPIKIICANLPDPYWRSKIINFGINSSANNICIVYDCDILIPKEQIQIGVELCNNHYDLIFPYTNPQYDVPQNYFSEFYVNYNFTDIQYKLHPRQLLHRHNEEKYPVIAYASGFSMILNRQKLGNKVFFNEEFVGWGYEDSEYIFRLDKFNAKMSRIYGPIFHVEHERTEQMSYKQYIDNNRNLYHRLINTPFDELNTYYSNLKLI